MTYRAVCLTLVATVWAVRSESPHLVERLERALAGPPTSEMPGPTPPPVHIDTSLATMLAAAPRLSARSIDATELGTDVRVFLVEQFGPTRDGEVITQASRVLLFLVGADRSIALPVGMRWYGPDETHPPFGAIRQVSSLATRGEARTFFEEQLPTDARTLLYTELLNLVSLTSSAYGIARAENALYVWSGGNDMRVVNLVEGTVVTTPSDNFALPAVSSSDAITMHEMVGAKNSIEITFTMELAVGARRGPLLTECHESIREGVGLVGWQHNTTGASFGQSFEVLAWRDCHTRDGNVSYFLRRENAELQLQRIGDGQVVFERLRIDP